MGKSFKNEDLLKDAYWFIINNPDWSCSYNEMHGYLLSKGYDIKNEGNEIFVFNSKVHSIFSRLTEHSILDIYSELFQKSLLPSEYTLLNKVTFLHDSYALLSVPFVVEAYKGDKDIYILSLEFFKENSIHGASFISYMHHIRNVIGINSLDNISLLRLYNEITNSKIEKTGADRTERKWSTVESIFRLLEYEELQQSLKESKEAKAQAIISTTLANDSIILARISVWIAIGGTILASILTIIFGMNQWKSSDKEFKKPIKKNIQIESPIIKPII